MNNNKFLLCVAETVSPKPSKGLPVMATTSGGSPAKVDNSAISTRQAYCSRILDNFNLLRQNSNNSLCDVEIIPGWYTQSSDTSTSSSSSSSSSSWLQRSGSNKLRSSDSIDPAPDAEGNVAPTNKPFFAHRTILAAASPYFNAMFTGGLVEARRQQIVLQSISDETLESLLDFIYSGEIKLTRDNVQEILIAGDMIELKEVVEMATNYLIRELDPTNALGVYQFANNHHCLALKAHAESYIHKNFVHVSKHEEFCELERDLLVNLVLSSEFLTVDSEHQVFSAAMTWIEADISSRRRFVFDILKYIRMPLVPSKLVESYLNECRDYSLKVALTSVRQDLLQCKGSLVPLVAEPRKCAKKTVYVIGGSHRELGSAWTRSEFTYESVEVFDTFTEKWGQVAPMKIGRILPGIGVMNGKIYVCGGEVESQILANGEVYDPNEDTWTEMCAMNIPRCEFGMCAFNGYLYAFGGWVGEDIGGSIERYDPSKDEWSLIAKMSEPRFSMGIIVHQGLIYLVGGCTHSRRHMQELVSYNPETGEWLTYESMLVPRSQMGCVVLRDYLYVLGGTNRQNEVLRSVERYCFKTNRWEIVSSMEESRASPSVAAANGKIYVFGGDQITDVDFYRARTTISATEVYDPLTNTWSKSVDLPQTRSEAGAVVI